MAFNLHHELSDPTDQGWVNDDSGKLGIHWTEHKSALEGILEFVTCSGGKSECGTNQCGCVVVTLPSTDLCLCKSCKNSNKDTNIDIENMLDEDICDSNDEYNKDWYDSDEEGCKLFLDKRVNHEKRIMTKAKNTIKYVSEKLKLLIHL